jgi:DNA-binding transcriptional LysR family regulator
MEIYQLRTFIAVARMGHLTRAAEQLNLTQPAVSKQIKALEQTLGVVLFERQPGGMLLTREGSALLPQAERTLNDAEQMLNQARILRGEVAGAVAIGTVIDPETLRLGEFLSALLAYFPKVQARLQHGISGGVWERVKSADLDAGFFLGPVVDADSNTSSLPLCTLTYVVIGPSEWQTQLDTADWPTIAALPWIGTPSQSSQHRLVRAMFAEHGLEVRPVIEADQEASMVSLVRRGVGLATMRQDLAQTAQAKGEIAIWPGTVQDCPLSFIYKTARHDDMLIAACRKALVEVWEG